jgi:sulfur-oxidizing protein SoxX
MALARTRRTMIGGLLALALVANATEAGPDLTAHASPLTSQAGDPQRGRRLIVDRQQGFCLLCHSGPFAEERFQGTLGPDLASVATRDAARLRARLIEPRGFNPDSIMPSYRRPSPGARVHPQFQGQALLQDQDVEDIVAYLVQMAP